MGVDLKGMHAGFAHLTAPLQPACTESVNTSTDEACAAAWCKPHILISDNMAEGILTGAWLQAYPYEGVTNFCRKNVSEVVRFKKVTVGTLPPQHSCCSVKHPSNTIAPMELLSCCPLQRCVSDKALVVGRLCSLRRFG